MKRGIQMTEEFVQRLMAAGLTKQQASSVTAETLVRLFMQDDGKILIREAQQQVTEMQALVNSLKREYDVLVKKVGAVSETLLAVSEAQAFLVAFSSCFDDDNPRKMVLEVNSGNQDLRSIIQDLQRHNVVFK